MARRFVPLAACVVAVVAAALGSAGRAAAAECPTQTFLTFGHLTYAARPLPAGSGIAPGAAVGKGSLDEPTEPSGCKRKRTTPDVLRAGTVEPLVALFVPGRPRTIFVLGARCAGYATAELADCLLNPVVFQGRRYTAMRSLSPGGSLPLGQSLGGAQFHGKVGASEIQGVDPTLAVGLRGRPGEAFVAAGVCPYGRLESRPASNDLLRCLRSPVWFSFDPPGGTPGDPIRGAADRPLGADLDGATVSLVRLPGLSDVVPDDRSKAVRIGAPAATFDFELPDLRAGLYEAIVSCKACAGSQGGNTLFPAGSLLVTSVDKGSSGPRIIGFVLGVVLLGLAVASIVVFRRSRARARPPSEPGSGGS